MRFTHLLAAGVTLLATVAAVISAEQVSGSLHDISIEQDDLVAPANQITIINAPLIIIGQGPFPSLIAGVTKVITRLQQLVVQLQGTEPFQEEAETIVVDAYLKFSKSQMDFLAVLNAKATVIEKVPLVGAPVAAILRSLEALDDHLTIALINLVENRGAIEKQGDDMGSLLAETIQKYTSIAQ